MDTPACVEEAFKKAGQAFILRGLTARSSKHGNNIQEKDTYFPQWNSTPAIPAGNPARQHCQMTLSAELCHGENGNGI